MSKYFRRNGKTWVGNRVADPVGTYALTVTNLGATETTVIR